MRHVVYPIGRTCKHTAVLSCVFVYPRACVVIGSQSVAARRTGNSVLTSINKELSSDRLTEVLRARLSSRAVESESRAGGTSDSSRRVKMVSFVGDLCVAGHSSFVVCVTVICA